MLNNFILRFQKFAPLALRWGLAIVFLLFGLKKLLNPGQTTSEIQLLLNFDLADAAAINYYLGLVEIIIFLTLFFGFRVRLFSLIAGILLLMFFSSFIVKFGLSINPDLYRDLGLIGASLALFLLGAGPISLDNLKKKNKTDEQIP